MFFQTLYFTITSAQLNQIFNIFLQSKESKSEQEASSNIQVKIFKQWITKNLSFKYILNIY